MLAVWQSGGRGMSDTPETERLSHCGWYRGTPITDAVSEILDFKVDLHFARKLERERDEALDVLSNISSYLGCGIGDDTTTARQYNEMIMDGIKLLNDLIVETKNRYKEEADEASRARDVALKVAHTYDEAHTKALEWWAQAERERDEARHEIEGWKNKWECAVEMAARAENERDEIIQKLEEILKKQ